MTCGNAKQLAFIQRAVKTELRWVTSAALPDLGVGNPFFRIVAEPVSSVLDNPSQRVHWNVKDLVRVCGGADIVVTSHEFLAIPLRRLFPKLKIVQMCNVAPDDSLFQLAWESADLVVVQGQYAKTVIAPMTYTPVETWELAYDEDDFLIDPVEKDVDVCFVLRCSATNYTHHEEFLDSLKYMPNYRTVFTDVTGYLRRQRPELTYSTPETYIKTLMRSRVAVALNDNMYGGLATREAARAGCSLVCLDAPCYRELKGAYFTSLDPRDIARTVRTALLSPSPVDVSKASYQAAWPVVKSSLEKILEEIL